MMARLARGSVLVALVGWGAGCAHADAPVADPEAEALAPPVVIVDEPPAPQEEALDEEADQDAPAALAKDPNTEVITFAGEDADPGMSDEVTGTPKRDPLPSMMSDVLHGPNK